MELVESLAKDFQIEIVDEINEESTYASPKLIIRRKNGLEQAMKVAQSQEKSDQ